MLNWAKIALLLLQVADKIISYLQERKLINQGYDKAIAENAANILRKSQYAKEIMANIDGLSGDAVDKLLRDLEPPEKSGQRG